jgi:hypothetical protein
MYIYPCAYLIKHHSTKVKNTRIYTSTTPYVFMA